MERTRNLRIASRSVLFALVVFALVLVLPLWPYSNTWGYLPGLIAAGLLIALGALFFRIAPRRL